MALVLLRDRDDQPEVRVDHPVLRLLVAALDALGELDLLLRGQQRIAGHLVQEELQRIGRDDREVAIDVRAVHLLLAAVVGDVHVVLLELLVEARDLLVTEVVRVDELLQLRDLHASRLGPVLHEGGDRIGAHRSAYPLLDWW